MHGAGRKLENRNPTVPADPKDDPREKDIRAYYHALFQSWGPQHWWPAQSRFEVIVGAYLTQNTAWTNVELALTNLRAARILNVNGIRRTSQAELEQLIRPAGYFRQKAERLKLFVAFLDQEHNGSLDNLFARPTQELRETLLTLKGIGDETADSILLYAGNHPVFVVDAYTRRILSRHEIISDTTSYAEIRELVERALVPRGECDLGPCGPGMEFSKKDLPEAVHPPSVMSRSKRSALAQVYNEMHGLIVGVGKNYCRKSQALCDQCPLQKFLPEL